MNRDFKESQAMQEKFEKILYNIFYRNKSFRFIIQFFFHP